MEEQEDARRGGRTTVHPWDGTDRYTVALREAIGPDPSDGSVTLAEGTLGDDLVYALGQIGQDFPTGSRRTSFAQRVDDPAVLDDPARFLEHLDANPSDATAVQWTLDLDGVPIYVLQPSGPFASDVYALLRQFMREQIEEGVERVSIPGVVSGSARHRSGLALPVVNPALRGMYSWTTQALVSAVMETAPAEGTEPKADDENKRAGVSNFLDRVYFELRNVGRDPHERAVNYAATNALEVERVYERAINEEMELETIDVEPSELCAPGSNCWDVKLLFFFPARPSVRRLYRFTIDVADVVARDRGTDALMGGQVISSEMERCLRGDEDASAETDKDAGHDPSAVRYHQRCWARRRDQTRHDRNGILPVRSVRGACGGAEPARGVHGTPTHAEVTLLLQVSYNRLHSSGLDTLRGLS